MFMGVNMPSCSMTVWANDRPVPPQLPAVRWGGYRTAGSHDLRPSDVPELISDVLDILADGLIVTDAAARILYMNRSAQAMVSRGSLSVRGGILGAGMAQESQKLQDLVASCIQGPEGRTHFRTSSHIFLTITTVGAPAGSRGQRCAAIFLRDADRVPGPSIESVTAYFGLTPAEARLAREITKGDGVARCARRLGTRVTTARSHLKHIFEKTHTRRQAHLVRLLLNCGSCHAEHGSRGCDRPAGGSEQRRGSEG